MTRSLVILLALAGCDWGLGSDPGLPACAVGHVRAADGCRAATAPIIIDGQTDDWIGIEEIPLTPVCTRPPCAGLLADTLQVAVQACALPGCLVFFRVRLAGGAAPVVDDPDLYFVLQLAPTPARPAAEIDALIGGATGISFQKNGHDVSPSAGAVPYQLAWTADGYEASIPAGYLPLRGAALVSPFAARAAGGVLSSVSDPPPVAAACWETHTDDPDPCTALAAEEVAR